MKEDSLDKFLQDQLSVWPLAAANFRSLKTVDVREFGVNEVTIQVQHNPERIQSTTAETDEATLRSRPCFLCPGSRPAEQNHIRFEGRKGRKYNIQVNPYPIFTRHFVVASAAHVQQSIWHRLVDMLDMCARYPEYTFFYNGPESGASAPDHMHFQACQRSFMPLENAVNDAFANGSASLEYLSSVQDAQIYHFTGFIRGVFALRSTTSKSISKLFYRFLDCLTIPDGEKEPRFNLFTWRCDGEFRLLVVLRSNLRSHHYFSSGEDHLTISPGCADMAGVVVSPVKEDFDKLTPELISEMYDEVSVSDEAQRDIVWRLTRKQPTLDVGIMSASEISFEIISDGAGRQKVSYSDGKINYNGILYDELYFDAVTMSTLFAEPSFILYNVPIGKDFHWQRNMTQRFAGRLKFIVEGELVTAVNTIGLEDYLLSVISSEMKASASLEFLKAHAIISRSWVLVNLKSHPAYDVCADDHCQRYQGLEGAVGENVRKAVDQTWGQVLTYDGAICDTRFSKCCGGRTEIFSTCWEDRDYPYLKSLPDAAAPGENPFCAEADRRVLEQVLNDYDLETGDYFEWRAEYSSEQLSALVKERSGMDFGEIRDLVPVKRGPSGRIFSLRIEGSLKTDTVGKELKIRRYLSPSHLKSSAFEVEKTVDGFILKGHGWGHGVGLCQIGAAVMADRGYDYKQILGHYYPGSEIECK